jgi:hypothetical protein
MSKFRKYLSKLEDREYYIESLLFLLGVDSVKKADEKLYKILNLLSELHDPLADCTAIFNYNPENQSELKEKVFEADAKLIEVLKLLPEWHQPVDLRLQ